MPSANKTEHYGLNQWQGNEYPKRQDFVDDNAIIDGELAERITREEVGVTVPSLVDGKVPESQLPVQGGSVYSAAAPTNTKLLWLDANSGGAAKFYNGTAWVNVPSVWG